MLLPTLPSARVTKYSVSFKNVCSFSCGDDGQLPKARDMGAGVGVRGVSPSCGPREEAALIIETGRCNIGISKERGIFSTCPGELGLPACWPGLVTAFGSCWSHSRVRKVGGKACFPGLLLVFVLVGSCGPLVF